MKKIVLRPVEGGQKSVELKIGKTIIGRGPLLDCSDKKVSRNHAVLEVTEDGEVFLTPTHVNPCFYQVQGKGPSKVMKKDKQQLLQSGDSIALLPNNYKYIVEVINSSSSSSISPGLKESQPADDADNKDSIAEKPATAVIPSEEARKNGSAEENHHSKTTVVMKTENGDRGSSKEASPEAVSKVTPAARKGVGGAPASKGDGGVSRSSTGATRTLPRWLLDSAAKSAATAASAKAKASSVQKDKNAAAESATAKRVGRVTGKVLATKARGRQPKESESEAEEDEPNQKSEDEAEEEKEEESEEEYKPKRKKPEQAERRPITASSGNRKGSRSSRQNRGLMQKISLDDFIASDDDEWDNSSDEWKPKKRRKQVDDSGSDWEEENRRTKKAPRYAASDSDSASDWERTSRRKKPATRTRNRRKRSTSEGGSSEESEKAPVRRGQRRQPVKRPNCKYGRKCFRKNAQHLKQFSHPKDSDYEGSSGDEDEDRDEDETKDHADGSGAESGSDRGRRPTKRPSATTPSKRRAKLQEESDDDNDKSGDEDDRPMCRYGKECFRKNAQHLKNFKHPPAASKKKEPAKQTSKKAKSRGKTKGSSEDEEAEGEAASGDEYEWKDDDDATKKSNEEDSSSEQKKATPAKRKRATERLAASAADD